MTVIAYRDGIIAADTLAVTGGSKCAGVTKVARSINGDLGGASGGITFMTAWLTWIRGEGARPVPEGDETRTDTGLIIWANGRIEVYEKGGSFEIDAPYYAIGSGRPEAMGAMHAGASPEGAVHAAIAHDVNCGGEPTILTRADKVVSLRAAE